MAKKILHANVLSVASLRALEKQLEDYEKSLVSKCEEFVRRLAESGISVAKQNTGGFGRYIVFETKLEPNEYGCKGVLIATETGKIVSEWKLADGTIKSADVSPLLMVEFGSGWRAENPMDIPGVGQGTFPGQKHATEPGGWSWQDLDGNWHHSYGISPKTPMYKASLEMREEIISTAQDVFGK